MYATINLLNSELMGEFYFTKQPEQLALNYLVEGRYKEVGPFEVGTLKGEDAAEELFDLTNNPYRQAEREQVYGRGRSLSVGDVVTIDGDLYLCASFGWKKLSVDMA